jgi:hypothetical protein
MQAREHTLAISHAAAAAAEHNFSILNLGPADSRQLFRFCMDEGAAGGGGGVMVFTRGAAVTVYLTLGGHDDVTSRASSSSRVRSYWT